MIEEHDIVQAGHELAGRRRSQHQADAIAQILPQITRFMDALKESHEIEDWFDPAIFQRMILAGTLYQNMEDRGRPLRSAKGSAKTCRQVSSGRVPSSG